METREIAMSIHDAVLDVVEAALQTALIDNVSDDTKAGVVQQGHYQDDPEAQRIVVTLFENDPDSIVDDGTSSMTGSWSDEPSYAECGGSLTWFRRFTVKFRALLTTTQEEKDAARLIASTLRTRIEHTLLDIDFSSVVADGEFVSKSIFSEVLRGEMIQAGGPQAFDYHGKVRFQVETTKGVQP